MPIDPNIALSIRPPQIENPLNAMLRVQQLRRGQQEEQLNALRMQQAQQQAQDAPHLHAQKVVESFFQNALGPISNLPPDQQEAAYNAGIQQVAAMGGDTSLMPPWQKIAPMAAAYGAPEPMNAYQQMITGETARHNKEMEAAARLRARNTGTGGASPYGTFIPTQSGILYGDNRTGNIGMAKGGEGMLPITGDPTQQGAIAREKTIGKGTGEQKVEAKKQTRAVDLVLPQLQDISKDGGLLDQATGSGLGRARDAAASLVGVATEGAVAIGKLQPIYDLVLKMVPRFEGPQSDKDTQSYREAAGQLADPSVPSEIKKAAAKTIIDIMARRREQFVETTGSETPATPEGVDPELWGEMTPEERALWQ